MTLGHLGFRIKRSCLRIFGVVSKEFSSRFSRSCMTPSKCDRLFSAAENLCAAISKPHQESFLLSKPHQESFLLQAAKNLFQGSQDSLRGATNLFRESQNSLWGAKDLFRESKNSLRGACNLFRESKNSFRGAGNLFRESQNSLWGTNCKLFWEAYKPNNGSKINCLTDACVKETMNDIFVGTINSEKVSLQLPHIKAVLRRNFWRA